MQATTGSETAVAIPMSPAESISRVVIRHRVALAAVVVVYIALAAARAWTDSPGCDEGWFASPAINLAEHGQMGTPVIEESNLRMTTGIHGATYWIMPLNVLVQAAVYKTFGFGLYAMRSISFVCGIAALLAWYSIICRLTGNRSLAFLTAAFIAVDFAFIRSAGNGRMDMMCAALNFCALAVYLALRERNFIAAVVVSNALVAASGLTHPNGLLGLMCLATMMLVLDRRRLTRRELVAASLPYLIGGLTYAPYVMRNTGLFLTQLSGNGGGRLWGLTNPIGALKSELLERYLGSGAGGAGVLKLALVVVYVGGVVGALAISEVRRRRGYRIMLFLALLYSAYFAFLEGTKLYLYLVHVTPIFAALVVAVGYYLWQRHSLKRAVLVVAFGVVLLNLAGTAYVIKRNSYHAGYLPVVSFLNNRQTASTTIAGTAELSFGLNRYESLLDDKWLGFNTGRQFDYVVVDARYAQEHEAVRSRQPEIYEYISSQLTNKYEVVYSIGDYTVYRRR